MKTSTIVLLIALLVSATLVSDAFPDGQPWIGLVHFAILWTLVGYSILTDVRTRRPKHAPPRRTHADDFRDKIARAVQRGRIAARIDADTDPACVCEGTNKLGAPNPDCPIHGRCSCGFGASTGHNDPDCPVHGKLAKS